jgi:Uma2 family endonuclease
MLDKHVTSNHLGEVFYSPGDVILGQGDAREVAQPDIVFIARSQREIIKLHGIEGALALVVEILSPGTEERDRGYRRTLYARHGVSECWIVDPDERTVEVHSAAAEGFAEAVTYRAEDTLSCALFPSLVTRSPRSSPTESSLQLLERACPRIAAESGSYQPPVPVDTVLLVKRCASLD